MACRSLFYRLWHDRAGATGIEYGLLLAIISLALLGASMTIGDYVGNSYTGFGNTLAGVSAPNTGTEH